MTANDIANAQNIINDMHNQKVVKYVKRDRGLLERKDYEDEIILTEDKRQVLLG